MGLYISSDKMVKGEAMVGLHNGQMKTLFVYGSKANLMVATRSAGYHSKPHRHDCEQLNYLLDGEIWIFIEQEGYHLSPGDFLRIPENDIHWAWNRGTQPCTLIQVHAPVLSPTTREGTVGLFRSTETPNVETSPSSETIDQDVAELEKRIINKG